MQLEVSSRASKGENSRDLERGPRVQMSNDQHMDVRKLRSGKEWTRESFPSAILNTLAQGS